MKKLVILTIAAVIAMPVYAQKLNLDSDNTPCLTNIMIQKGKVYQVSAYDYEYLQLPDRNSFSIKDHQGKILTPTYQHEIKAYIVFPPNTADEQNTLYLTAKKTGKISSVCLYSAL